MAGRLVGEVAEWLRSPAAAGLTLAERAVLLIIAERAHEKTRQMWRYKTDDVTSFEYICQVTGMDRGGLTKALRKLAARDLEVRVPLDFDRNGKPVFAYRGAAMKFALPELPASVTIPQRVDDDPPFNPVDNPPAEAPQDPPTDEKGWTSGHPYDGKGGPEGTHTARKGGRSSTPNPYKEDPYKDHPYSSHDPLSTADLEDTPPPAAPPRGQTDDHTMGFDTAYKDAVITLTRFPDFGEKYIAQAKTELGDDVDRHRLYIRAAQFAQEGISA